MEKEIKNNMSKKMDATIEALRREFAGIRTGRASLGLLDGIHVDYYGTPTPVNQVAALSIPEPKTILISPWEPKMISEIERAIMKSDLGLTPANDGKAIRLPIPALTEERRKDLVKVVKKKAEEARVALRNIRRDANEHLKKLEKDKHLSEDDVKKALDEVQKTTDQHIQRVDEVLHAKEKEIMEV